LRSRASTAKWKISFKVSVFLTDIRRSFLIYREVRDKFVNVVALPASTTLEASKLAVRAHFWKWEQSRYCRSD